MIADGATKVGTEVTINDGPAPPEVTLHLSPLPQRTLRRNRFVNRHLERKGRELFHSTMGVLGANTFARGITEFGRPALMVIGGAVLGVCEACQPREAEGRAGQRQLQSVLLEEHCETPGKVQQKAAEAACRTASIAEGRGPCQPLETCEASRNERHVRRGIARQSVAAIGQVD